MCVNVFGSLWLGNLIIDFMISVRLATVYIRDQTGPVQLCESREQRSGLQGSVWCL